MARKQKTNYSLYRTRAFSTATVKTWNDLPLDIRMAKTVDAFISKLKTHFFRIVYYPCCIIALMNISSNGTMDSALTKSNLLLLLSSSSSLLSLLLLYCSAAVAAPYKNSHQLTKDTPNNLLQSRCNPCIIWGTFHVSTCSMICESMVVIHV